MATATASRFSIEYARFISAILLDVIDSARNGDIELAEFIGIDLNTVNKLSQLKPEQLAKVANNYTKFNTKEIIFKIDPNNISNLVKAAEKESQRLEMIDEYIVREASNPLLQNFFGMLNVQVATRKKILGVKTIRGRKRYITDGEKRHCWDLYLDSLTNEPDEAQRLLDIARKTNFSLHNIYAAICEVKDSEFTQPVVKSA